MALEKYFNLAERGQAKADGGDGEGVTDARRARGRGAPAPDSIRITPSFQRRYATLGLYVIPKHNYYNKQAPRSVELKAETGAAMAWIEKLVEAMDADEVLLGAHRAAVAALKKREAEEALKQGMARLQRDRAEREKRKQKQAADAALPLPLVRGARVRGDGSSGSVVECHRDCPEGPYYDVALDGGRVVQAERNLELIAGKPTAPSAPPPPVPSRAAAASGPATAAAAAGL